MSVWPRRGGWTGRGIRLRLMNIPQQLCRGCFRLTVQVCQSETARFAVVFVTLCLMCCALFSWMYLRDPCFQWELRRSLCEDYRRGLVAGALCYDLCLEHKRIMSNCIDQSETEVVFEWESTVVKVQNTKTGHHMSQTDHTIWEGMSTGDVITVLDEFFISRLGDADHSSLMERVLEFADFNMDGKLMYGEVRSIWQLLNIPEFFTLFLFQRDTVFPAINGTCGTLFAFEKLYHQVLYDKTPSSFFDTIFPFRFRWSFPQFPRRVHIALGLLEYASLVMEEENTRFYMCDFSPKNFGYSEYYQLKVSNLQGIMSEAMLNKSLMEIHCESKDQCIMGTLCQTTCNTDTHFCNGVSVDQKPDLIKICEILIDYILFDTPGKLRFSLAHLISQCNRMSRDAHLKHPLDLQVAQNVLLDRLKELLWDELKNEENTWLYKPTTRPGT